MFLGLLLFCLVLPPTFSLKCYEGSKGTVNGVEKSNFRVRICDEDMMHCFSSYSDDWNDVTAGCQTPSTDEKLLSVCKTGCLYHSDINVTVCCCGSDLCNMPTRSTTVLPPTSHGPKAVDPDLPDLPDNSTDLSNRTETP